jgi:uncharacterized membrane protein YoaK (UPF0700 family)
VSVWREIRTTVRPDPASREGTLPPLLLALTAVSGMVDAGSYLRLGHVFVANMTGNVVLMGFAIAGAHGLSIWASLIALAGFLAGGVAGGRLGARIAARGRLLAAAVGIELIGFAAAALIAATVAAPGTGWARYVVTGVLACGMGLQNATARRIGVADITTTVLTMTLTGIAADSPAGGGSGAGVGRRLLVVATMLSAAVVGGLLAVRRSLAAPLIAATAVLAVTALAARRTAPMAD